MTEHELKTWPKYFQEILDGKKKFELRKNDRNFELEDILYLKEWSPETQLYTGRSVKLKVIYMVKYFIGLEPGYVIMGIEVIK